MLAVLEVSYQPVPVPDLQWSHVSHDHPSAVRCVCPQTQLTMSHVFSASSRLGESESNESSLACEQGKGNDLMDQAISLIQRRRRNLPCPPLAWREVLKPDFLENS